MNMSCSTKIKPAPSALYNYPCTWSTSREYGLCSRGDEDVLGCVAGIPHHDFIGSLEGSVTNYVLHVILGEVVAVDAIQPLDVLISALLHCPIRKQINMADKAGFVMMWSHS